MGVVSSSPSVFLLISLGPGSSSVGSLAVDREESDSLSFSALVVGGVSDVPVGSLMMGQSLRTIPKRVTFTQDPIYRCKYAS